MNHRRSIVVAAAFVLAAHAAHAQAVWRCGSSYSQQPCAGGSVVTAADPRTSAEAMKSSSVAQADMRLADKMEKERLLREKNAPKALVIGPQAAAPAPAAPQKGKAKAHPKGKPGDADLFTASSPRPPAEKKTKAKKT